MAHDVVDEAGVWKKKLTPQCLELFELLPLAIQEQLLLERDPHGNVQVNIDHGQSRFYSVLHNLITSVISAGCENWNWENAYSNGWNWVGSEEAEGCI